MYIYMYTKASNDDNFTEVTYRKKNRRQNVTFGENNSALRNFVGIPRKAWLYLGRVDKKTTENDILQYLEGRFVGNKFTCEKLGNNDHSSSYKISAPINLLDDLKKGDIWPVGVYVRRFKFSSNAKNNDSATTNPQSATESIWTVTNVNSSPLETGEVSKEDVQKAENRVITRTQTGTIRKR